MSSLDEKLKMAWEGVAKRTEQFKSIDELAKYLNTQQVQSLRKAAEAEFTSSMADVIPDASKSLSSFFVSEPNTSSNIESCSGTVGSIRVSANVGSSVESEESEEFEEEPLKESIPESTPRMLAKREKAPKLTVTKHTDVPSASNVLEDARPKRQRVPTTSFDPWNQFSFRVRQLHELRQMLSPADAEAYKELQSSFGEGWRQVPGRRENLHKRDGVIVNLHGKPYRYDVEDNPVEGTDFFVSAQNALAYCKEHCKPVSKGDGARGSERKDK